MFYKYCGLTIRADANSDDVRVLKKGIRMVYFKRFGADENHSVLYALKVQISYISAGYW